ncbi:DUF3140 domain-containing protein [Aquipuribacter nitratireducens]|uniref:DUF3140 domain-containing protein n=1 Tax=Aquipuribacter nitratireducens TaxID=650104 RepID=A0ABW0GSG7_9MICO
MPRHDLDDHELDELWEQFHTVVNMTSKDLSDWLRVRAADEDAEAFLDETGHMPGLSTGQHVLRILGRRKTDLDEADVTTMARVVDRVTAQRREDLEPTAGDAAWRHELMTIGHDPLQPPRGG